MCLSSVSFNLSSIKCQYTHTIVLLVFIKFTFYLSRWTVTPLELGAEKPKSKENAVYSRHRIRCREKRPSWDQKRVPLPGRVSKGLTEKRGFSRSLRPHTNSLERGKL